MHMYIYAYVYIVQKQPSPPIPRHCHAHKVDTSPAFQQHHAKEIGYSMPIIFNWVLCTLFFFCKDDSVKHKNRSQLCKWSLTKECERLLFKWSRTKECERLLFKWSLTKECERLLFKWSLTKECERLLFKSSRNEKLLFSKSRTFNFFFVEVCLGIFEFEWLTVTNYILKTKLFNKIICKSKTTLQCWFYQI